MSKKHHLEWLLPAEFDEMQGTMQESVQNMESRLETQPMYPNQITQHLIERQPSKKPFPNPHPYLHPTTLSDQFKPNPKIPERPSWPEQIVLPTSKRRNSINIKRDKNSLFHKLYYQDLGYLITHSVPFKPSLPASKGMMSVIEPPQMVHNPTYKWTPLFHR